MSHQSEIAVTEAPALYDAFVSYNHAKDKPVCSALQTVMQKLGKPWYQRRGLRIFRDDTSLAATPELWPALEKTLSQTRYIILIASPEFARSKWCGMEVAYWLEHKSLDTLLIAVTDGELTWDSGANDFVWDAATPLPPVLRGWFRNEPKWIDLRPHREAPNASDPRFVDAAADLAAAVHGLPKEDLLSQEVRQQKRALRLARAAVASLMLLAGGAGWQWWSATIAKRAAEEAQKRAVVERDRAESNLAVARTSADDLVFKIARGLRNVQGMSTEAIRQILETSQTIVDELQKNAPDDASFQQRRAILLYEFATVHRTNGDLAKAKQAAEESLAINRRLMDAEPNAKKIKNTAVGVGQLGDIQSALGDSRAALGSYEESVELGRKVLAMEPDNADYQHDLSISLNIVGGARADAGNAAGARQAYEESFELVRKLAEQDGASAKVRLDYTYSIERLASLKSAAGDNAGALRDYQQSLAIRRKIAAENPTDFSYQTSVAWTLSTMGTLFRSTRDLDSALAHYGESVAIMRRVSGSDTGNKQWLGDTALMIERLGDIYRTIGGRENSAMLLYSQALDLRRRLAKSDASNFGWQDSLSVSLQRYGDALISLKNYKGALAAYEENHAMNVRVLAIDPQNGTRQRNYMLSLARVGDAKRDLNDLEGARAAYEECLELARKFLAREPANVARKADLGSQLYRIGNLLARAGDKAAALPMFEELYAVRREAADKEPQNLDAQVQLALGLYNVSTVAPYPRARAALVEAIERLEPFARANRMQGNHANIPRLLREELAKLDETAKTQ